MSSYVYKVKVGGQAGQGVKSVGLLLAKLASRSGYWIYNYIEYPSLIRGGHNVMQVNISKDVVSGPSTKTDYLIALNQDTINKHLDEFTGDAVVLCDNLDTSKIASNVHVVNVPFAKLATDSGGKELLSNVVAVGAFVALSGADINKVYDLIKDEFGSKGTAILDSNIKAVEFGYNYVISTYSSLIKSFLKPLSNIQEKMVLNGDEAVALAAISAGMQFAAIYPMSPISNIIQILAANQEKFGYIYKQPEDEIAAINMAIGASFAGVRSMTATSGGGFCLMSEGYGLAGMTETPLVIIEGMRGAPATGLPTWTEQGDLQFILHAHQGDFPRIVLAAGDLVEAFYLTMEAFYMADKYQAPVVIIIDKNICDHEQSVPKFDISNYVIDRGKFLTKPKENYKRYELTTDGVSTRAVPGSSNFFIANSDEHDEFGLSSEEADNRIVQMNKRMSKIDMCAKNDMPEPQLFGPQDAEITIVSWGSNKGTILQALNDFKNVNFLHLTWMNPFPTDYISKILGKAKYIIDIECNYTGQLASIIREKTGIDIKDKMLKCDGRPFFVEEITEKLNSCLKGVK